MAQLEPVKIHVDLTEVHRARVLVKKLIKDAEEANRLLARAEERMLGLPGLLADYGISLEVQER